MNTQIRNADVHDVDSQDNSTATATLAAPSGGQCNYVTSVFGGYDGNTTGDGNTLILKEGSTELRRWYVWGGAINIELTHPIRVNGAANLELAASGTASENGTASISGYVS